MSGTEAKNDLTDLREAVDRVSAKLAEREQAIQAGIDAEDAAALAAEEKAAQEEAARKATEREGDIKKGASQAEASIRAGLRSGPKAKVTYTDLQAAAARRLAGLPPLSLLESLEEAKTLRDRERSDDGSLRRAIGERLVGRKQSAADLLRSEIERKRIAQSDAAREARLAR